MSKLIHLVRVEDDQYKMIEQIAKAQRRSVTKELEGAIENHIDKHKSFVSKENRGTAKEYLKGAVK